MDVADLEATVDADPQRGLDLRRPLVARVAPATTPRARTTSCPRAASRGAAARSPVETFGKYNQVQRITREGLAALRPAIRTLAEAEGLLAHRDAVEVRFDDGRPPRRSRR